MANVFTLNNAKQLYIKNLRKLCIRDFIAKDPYIWCRHFQRRVREFFKNVLLVKDGPLGNITNYFYRIEYQHRGTEHVHCLLWASDAPKPGDDEETVIRFIDEKVTARKPDPVTEQELYDLVTTKQMHWKKHSKTCKRIIVHRRRRYEKCRFEFPRPATGVTKINRKAADFNFVGGNTKYYSLRRRKGDEQWINDYNPSILLAWKANIDVQFLSKDLLHIVNYVTGYSTKGESSKQGHLFDTLKDSTISRRDRFRIYHDFLKKREMGIMEIVDMIMGHHLFEFDSGHVFINSNSENNRFRILIPKDDLEKKKDTDDVFQTNWPDSYYGNREPKFVDYSYFNMMVNFKIQNQKLDPNQKDFDANSDNEENEGGEDEFGDEIDTEAETKPDNAIDKKLHDKKAIKIIDNNPLKDVFDILNNYSPFFCHPSIASGEKFNVRTFPLKKMVKQKALVPRLYWPKLEVNNEKSRDDYFRRLCMIFIPWQNEAEFIKDLGNFEEIWKNFMKNLEAKSIGAFNDIQKVIRNQTTQLEMEQEIYDARKLFRQIMVQNNHDDEPDDALEVYDRVVDEAKVKVMANQRNAGQIEITDYVLEEIDKQVKNHPDAKPLLMFISGTAGVGKSFTINYISDSLFIRYCSKASTSTRPPALISAPTGLAAIQIKGSTIHSLFDINVQHGRDGKLSTLTPERLNLKRMLFKDVKLIIIDEISMVSNALLAKIHIRLTQFKGNNEIFGGVNIIALGDLLQLPPVRAQPIFEPLTENQVNKIFDSFIADFTFWELFEYRELLENMRQKDSVDLAKILENMRVQALTEEDHAKLRKRIIPGKDGKVATMDQLAEKYIELRETDPSVMALFSTQDEVNAFNYLVTQKLNLPIVTIYADDSEVPGRKNKDPNKRRRPYQTKEFSIVANKTTKKSKSSRLNQDINATNTSKDKDDQRAAAGLTKTLHLAVGCRIMLRRNVDAKIGLVNGATGVLKEIIFVNGHPTELLIDFDNIDGIQSISKVSAIFDVSAELQCTRHQFPVSMSFAATIHKCQGLTLKNVIVSFETIFAAGQAFVACSRVQTMDGLWLADYNPNKVYVHVASLQEYNRLRKTRDLPVFTIPPRHTKPANTTTNNEPNNSRKRKGGEQTTSLLLVPQIKKQKINNEEIAEPKVIEENDSTGQPLMKLQQSETNSYIISAINFLQRLPSLVEYLQHNPQTNSMLLELTLILNNSESTITRLQTDFEQVYPNLEPTALNFLSKIMLQFPVEAKFAFQIDYKKTIRCGCGTKYEPNSIYTIPFSFGNTELFPIKATAKENKLNFDEFFKKWQTSSEKCVECSKMEANNEKEKICDLKYSTIRMQNPQEPHLQYILIEIDGMYVDPLAKTKINKPKKRSFTVTGLSEVKMFNFNWILIAAIEKKPKFYITWVKTNSGWRTINGAIIDKKPSFTPSITNYCLLLYKRDDE